jgi:hypothetical protein
MTLTANSGNGNALGNSVIEWSVLDVGSIEDAKNLVEPLETQYMAVTAALKDALQQMD